MEKPVTRHYFHVTTVAHSYRDNEGILCIDAEQAKSHACLMVRELAFLLNDELADERLKALSIQVTDEEGNEVTRMPITTSQGGRIIH